MGLMRKKIIFTSLVIVISALAAAGYMLFGSAEKASAPTTPTTSQQEVKDIPKATPPAPAPDPVPAFNKQKYPLDQPGSLWVVVNKKRPLPSNYAPAGLTSAGVGLLRAEAASALNGLLTASSNAGYPMSILSTYRSYSSQQSTYNGWVTRDGQALADTYSARPGHSEHQTGLAVDLGNGTCNLETCFGNTPAGQWLAANAHKYGFIIRYPNGKQNITGYQYEPWHLRYLGSELSSEIYKTGQVMEEYFGLSAASNY